MNELTLERTIPADRERVFAAWTQPELLRRWSAPQGLTISDGATDLRVGGGWRVVMVEPGGATHEAFGTYHDIVAPERLQYTHAWRTGDGTTPETALTVEFHPDGDGTRLRFSQSGFSSPEARDGHREGWSSAFDNLQALFQPAAETEAAGAGTGRFTWFDLLTNDVEAAKRFYTAAIGWTVRAWGEGPKAYSIFAAGETPVGGVMEPSAEMAAAGVAPHWMGYVVVHDVDATARRAEPLGGRIITPGTDIPGVGRFAVIADPQGATFALSTPSEPSPAPDAQQRGAIGWPELHTTEHEDAWSFYAGLFGWTSATRMDMDGAGTYHIFRHPHDAENAWMGGMFDGATLDPKPPQWMFYFNVDDMESAVRRIGENGGRLLDGPMPVPGGGVCANCMDPQGGRFAIFAME